MSDPELLRQFYNLSDEFSTEWSETNSSSINLNELGSSSAGDTSKYALLWHIASSASSAASEIPQDEPDPLGSTTSIISVLRSRGVDISDFSKRNKYFISSTSFSPRIFLRDMHPDATYDNLVNALNYLETTISERSEALKYLVEHDYDRFVQAKSSLDSVFKNIQAAAFNDPESSMGFQQLKSLIDESNSNATILMKPVMDNNTKDERLKTALSLVTSNKYFFNLPSLILSHINNNDHDSLIRNYRRGKDMRANENEILLSSESLTANIEQQRVLERIWDEVETIVDEYKQQEWKALSNTTAEHNYISIITRLLELGVEDNPIFDWISSQLSKFESDFENIFKKLYSILDIYRANILAVPQNPSVPLISAIRVIAEEPHAQTTSTATNSEGQASSSGSSATYDNPNVIEMWLAIRLEFQDINNLISMFCVFWKRCLEFVEGIPQRQLPTGWQNESKGHLSFSQEELSDIMENGQKIVSLVSTHIYEFFSTTVAATGSTIDLKASTKDEVPKFLPPFSNALSTVKYLSKIIFLAASGFSELAVNFDSPKTTDTLRKVLKSIRERAISSIIYAWEQDAATIHLVEDWMPSQTRTSTNVPGYFYAYQNTVLMGISDVLRLENDGHELQGTVIPPQSSTLNKQIQSCFYNTVSTTLDTVMKLMVSSDKDHRRSSFLGISNPSSSNVFDKNQNLMADPTDRFLALELLPENVSEEKKILLTLTSLERIRDDKLPTLFRNLDSSLNTNSKEAHGALRSSIDKMTSTLFELYNRRKKTLLAEGLRQGILKSGIVWRAATPETPAAVSSYIYECLLSLVVVHSHISDIAPSQVTRIITVLYDHIVKTLLSCFREVEQFGRYGLLQSIADIGLIRVTMEKFQTPDMLQSYSLIYDCIKEATIDRKALWESAHPPWEIIHPLVLKAQSSSKAEFRCFQNAKN